MNRRTLYVIAFVFAALLLIIILGIMGMIVMHGGFDMMHSIHATIPLLCGSTKILEWSRVRECNVQGSTIQRFDGNVLAEPWGAEIVHIKPSSLDASGIYHVKFFNSDDGYNWIFIQDKLSS